MPTHNPRLNVTVTPEQHSLLLELAQLNGGSASGYLRQMLDHATPLLRATVPALRLAVDDMNATRGDAEQALGDLLRSISQAGVNIQPDLLDGPSDAVGSRQSGQRKSPRDRAPAGGAKAR